MDITKLLSRGKRVAGGESDFVCVHFKYDQIPQCCYHYGILVHGDHDCLMWITNKEKYVDTELPYGS